MDNIGNVGILDPRGLKKNPFTGERYSKKYKEYSLLGENAWSSLPVAKHIPEIIKNIQNNRVNIITAGTGGGKSVIIPRCALHTLGYKGRVVMTVPKRMLAREAAIWNAKHLDVMLGKEVGYNHKDSILETGLEIEYKGEIIKLKQKEESSTNETKLLYATDGTINSMILRDRNQEKEDAFNIIIIDEAHERSVQIDQLLYLSREILRNNPKFKLIILSATIDVNLFSDYYKEFNPVVSEYEGTTPFPVEKFWAQIEVNDKNYISAGLEIVEKILNPEKKKEEESGFFSNLFKSKKSSNFNENGGILFFVPTLNDAQKFCDKMSSSNFKKGIYKPYCIELSGKVDEEDKQYAIHIDKYKSAEDGPYDRKVVASTNIAESSITIKDLSYVIDSGFEFSVFYDPLRNAKELKKAKISKAQAKQRWGRVGRMSEGRVYCLYTEEQYEKFEEFPEPKIKKERVERLILDIINIAKEEDKNLPGVITMLNEFIEPPQQEFIQSGSDILKSINAINDDNKFEPLAFLLSKLGIQPRNAKIIIEGIINNEQTLSITLVAILEMINRLKDIGTNLSTYADKNSDIITIKNVHDAFKGLTDEGKNDFCEQNNFDYEKLTKITSKIKEIKKKLNTEYNRKLFGKHNLMKTLRVFPDTIPKYDNKEKLVSHILLSGLNTNLSKKLKGKNLYRNCFPSIIESFPINNTYVDVNKDYSYIIYSKYVILPSGNNMNLITRIHKDVLNNLRKEQVKKIKNCLDTEILLVNIQKNKEKLYVTDDFNDDHIFQLKIKEMPKIELSYKEDLNDFYPLYISPDLAELPRIIQLLKQFNTDLRDLDKLNDDMDYGIDFISQKATDTINLIKIISYNYSKLKEKYDTKLQEIEEKRQRVDEFREQLDNLKGQMRNITDQIKKHEDSAQNIKKKLRIFKQKVKENDKKYKQYLDGVQKLETEILPKHRQTIKKLETKINKMTEIYLVKEKELGDNNIELELLSTSLSIVKKKLEQMILMQGGGFVINNIINHFGGKLDNILKKKLDLILKSFSINKVIKKRGNVLFKQFSNDEILSLLQYTNVSNKYLKTIDIKNRKTLEELFKLLILCKLGKIYKREHLNYISEILDLKISTKDPKKFKKILQQSIKF